MSLNDVATALLVPPVNLLPLGLGGLALAWRGYRAGLLLATVSLVGLLALSLPVTANLLIRTLETGAREEPAGETRAGAIVILSAEGREFVPGGILTGDDVGGLTLERLRAGAYLQRATGLPLLVSGGVLGNSRPPIAETMAIILARDFNVRTRWIENRSQDTWENAAFSASLLRDAGVTSVRVVTHAWHMPRALQSFAAAGMTATAAPISIDAPQPWHGGDLAPSATALLRSYWAFHEWIGMAAYSFRR